MPSTKELQNGRERDTGSQRPRSVSLIMRELASTLAELRNEANDLGSGPDSDIRITITAGQALARRLKFEPSPIDTDRLRDLRQVALHEATPRQVLIGTR